MHRLPGPLAVANPVRFDRQALLNRARLLQQAAQSGSPQLLLRGKKLGLLQESGDFNDCDSLLFCKAAQALGAHVAHIRSTFTPDSVCAEVQDTARLLGRLYDAVECQGLTSSVVDELAATAGIPVYDGLASASHASAALAALLAGNEPLSDKRCYVVQAMLVATIV
jgi:ornithine carbamoyltransferase